MIYDEKARKQIDNVFEFILIAAERSREINIKRNSDGTNSTLLSKNTEYTHQQAVREIVEGTIGHEYLDKLKSRKHKSKMR